MSTRSPTAHAKRESRPLSVVIGDDSPVVARGIAGLIADQHDMVVAAVASDRDALMTAIVRHDPDVVMSDLRMPPTHIDEGLQVLRQMESQRIRAGFIIFSAYADSAVVAALLAQQARGRGYLLKDQLHATDELVSAIRAVAAGNTVIDPALVTRLMSASPSSIPHLPAAQQEVLSLIARGMSNDAIAEHLHITEGAVQKRINALFRSLDLEDSPAVNRRVAATLRYLESRRGAPD